MPTKGDRVDTAYSMLRISGQTRVTTDTEKALALGRLETMAHGYQNMNIDTGYFFEETPNLLTNHRMQWGFRDFVSANLAITLPDYNKEIHADVRRMATVGHSQMSNITAVRPPLLRSRRSPIGSGNRRRYYGYWRTTQPFVELAPASAQTFKLIIGDIENYSEPYMSYLGVGETIDSYTIDSDDGLVVVSSALASPLINYQIRADGTSNNVVSNDWLQLKITAVTSTGRQTVRWTNFILIDASDIPAT